MCIEKVMKWHQKRAKSGKKMYQVAVNISVNHFFHRILYRMLKELVQKYDVAPKYLRLEITESIGLVDFEEQKIFNELKRRDLKYRLMISVSDFPPLVTCRNFK